MSEVLEAIVNYLRIEYGMNVMAGVEYYFIPIGARLTIELPDLYHHRRQLIFSRYTSWYGRCSNRKSRYTEGALTDKEGQVFAADCILVLKMKSGLLLIEKYGRHSYQWSKSFELTSQSEFDRAMELILETMYGMGRLGT